jgi:hypothetical protein
MSGKQEQATAQTTWTTSRRSHAKARENIKTAKPQKSPSRSSQLILPVAVYARHGLSNRLQ